MDTKKFLPPPNLPIFPAWTFLPLFWARIFLVQSLISFLTQQDECFEGVANAFYQLKQETRYLMERLYDIPSAIHILTTGNYGQLPASLKSILPSPSLTEDEKAKTVTALERVIRLRLLKDEVLPLEMRHDMEISRCLDNLLQGS